MLDDRSGNTLDSNDVENIKRLCDRRFGIGADGLIMLREREGYDFEMLYFNADGREGTMCGNGGRCAVAFAKYLGIIADGAHFLAVDGPHDARIDAENWVDLKMKNVTGIEVGPDYFVMDTGSPHYVIFVEDLDDINVKEQGQAIRYSERFRKQGINVNFVEERAEDAISVATYERGVEAETLSCGTGVTACSIANYLRQRPDKQLFETEIQTMGGGLRVHFRAMPNGDFHDIWLCGKTDLVFSGEMEI